MNITTSLLLGAPLLYGWVNPKAARKDFHMSPKAETKKINTTTEARNRALAAPRTSSK